MQVFVSRREKDGLSGHWCEKVTTYGKARQASRQLNVGENVGERQSTVQWRIDWQQQHRQGRDWWQPQGAAMSAICSPDDLSIWKGGVQITRVAAIHA